MWLPIPDVSTGLSRIGYAVYPSSICGCTGVLKNDPKVSRNFIDDMEIISFRRDETELMAFPLGETELMAFRRDEEAAMIATTIAALLGPE
jgi:hypothetical protein